MSLKVHTPKELVSRENIDYLTEYNISVNKEMLKSTTESDDEEYKDIYRRDIKYWEDVRDGKITLELPDKPFSEYISENQERWFTNYDDEYKKYLDSLHRDCLPKIRRTVRKSSQVLQKFAKETNGIHYDKEYLEFLQTGKSSSDLETFIKLALLSNDFTRCDECRILYKKDRYAYACASYIQYYPALNEYYITGEFGSIVIDGGSFKIENVEEFKCLRSERESTTLICDKCLIEKGKYLRLAISPSDYCWVYSRETEYKSNMINSFAKVMRDNVKDR